MHHSPNSPNFPNSADNSGSAGNSGSGGRAPTTLATTPPTSSQATSSTAPTVADVVTDQLHRHGVRRAYTVPGESFLGLLDAVQTHPTLRLMSTRHESGAAFMAEADAKLTGTPALALASRGPGAANLSIGVHTARQDQTPMLVILGQVESDLRGHEAFQEVDLAAFFAPISKWSVEARYAAQVPELVVEGLRVATTGRPGPVVISVPADFWAQPALAGSPPAGAGPSGPHPAESDPDGTTQPPSTLHAPTPAPSAPVADLERAADELANLLERAERPVMVAGPRLHRPSLREVAERFGVGVYSAFRRQDAFEEHHPHYLGHLGLGVAPAVRQSMDDADLVLVLGTRLDAMSSRDFTSPGAGSHLIVVGEGLPTPQHRGLVTMLDVPAREVLDVLATRPGSEHARARDWSAGHAAWTAFATPPPAEPNGRVKHSDLLGALREAAPPNTVITQDAGNFSGFVHRYWGFAGNHRMLGPCNGAMGYAVPAAVAAKLAEPDRTAIAMVGDGGALMTGNELEVAARYVAPVLVVVYQNGLYGTIAHHQAREHGRLSAVDIGAVDLPTWAQGLGAAAYTIDRADECPSIVAKALASVAEGRSAMIVVRTDPDQITADHRLSEIAPGIETGAGDRT